MGPGHCACCQLMETWACLPPPSLPPPHLPPSPLLPAHTASLFILCRPPSSPARSRFLSLSPGPVQELEQNVPVSWASCLPWACREGPSLAEGPEPRRPSGFGSSQTQGPGRSSGRSCPGASEAAAPRPASPLSRLLPEAVPHPDWHVGRQEPDSHPLTQLMVKLIRLETFRSAIALCQHGLRGRGTENPHRNRGEASDPESAPRGNQSQASGFLSERCPLESRGQPRRLPSSLSGAPGLPLKPPPCSLGSLSPLRAHSQGVGWGPPV